VPQLKDHLLSRLTGQLYDGDEHAFSYIERDSLRFVQNRLYRHKVLRVNYTTAYDMRRDQDSINPRTHPDIMLMAHEDDLQADPHPYWYARVIGIYHVNALHSGRHSASVTSKRMDFLWVRWFGRDFEAPGGFAAKRLHRIGFIPQEDGGAFGFLDPQVVLRGVHLIPGFAHGQTDEYLGMSVIRPLENDLDWVVYYVNMFVDRDMFMRYLGGGVGHQGAAHFMSVDPSTNRSQLDDDDEETIEMDGDAGPDEAEAFGYLDAEHEAEEEEAELEATAVNDAGVEKTESSEHEDEDGDGLGGSLEPENEEDDGTDEYEGLAPY